MEELPRRPIKAQRSFGRRIAFFLVAVFALAEFLPLTTHAAAFKGYEAMLVSKTGGSEISMKAGESKTIVVGFQNVGTTTWTQEGTGFVSIYTYDPKYRRSVFQDASWYKIDQPARLVEPSVATGHAGSIRFVLRAPQTAGVYTETFQLAAEDTAWIPGGKFSLNIRVAGETQNSSTSQSTSTSTSSSTDDYAASILLKSSKTVKAKGSEAISFTVGIKNTGTAAWKNRSIHVPGISIASSSDYVHSSWKGSVAVAKNDTEVTPGGLDLLTFQFRAPAKRGNYTATFVLSADNVEVPGSEIDIPIEVTSDAPEVKDKPKREEVKKKEKEKKNLMDEPTMRVGVLIVDEETDHRVRITCESDFEVHDDAGKILASLKDGEEVEAYYKNEKYVYEVNGDKEKTSSYLRFIPEEKNAVCTVTNFDRRKTRAAGYADNTFRNILELRYNSGRDRVWLINELSMEMYLRGLAETSNISHMNFQRTLITAARTYALYHFERATKHADEYFHVDAYADQVYKGYGQEQRTPRLTQSVEDTQGFVVTYDNKTAITPYFSRSDGHTRDWSEVWYGNVAWLKSVPTPCDKGKTLWGHGVGMSASEALCQANNGKDWKEILTYFYTGVEIKQRWK